MDNKLAHVELSVFVYLTDGMCQMHRGCKLEEHDNLAIESV